MTKLLIPNKFNIRSNKTISEHLDIQTNKMQRKKTF